MSFRVRGNKKHIKEERVTLESKHESIINDFNNNEKKVDTLKKKLKSLNTKLKRKTKKYTPIINLAPSDPDFSLKEKFTRQKELDNLQNQIDEMQKQIETLSSSHNKNEYYINSLPLIRQYNDIDLYEKKGRYRYHDKASLLQNTSDDYLDNPGKVKSLDDFFIKKNFEKPDDNDEVFNKKKASILIDYLREFDDDFQYTKRLYTAGSSNKEYMWCSLCNMEKTLIHDEGVVLCTSCQLQEKALIDCTKPSYKETTQQEICYFSYKKMNHFNEWIYQSQGKETTTIPKFVYETLLMEIKKDNLRIDDLSNDKVRSYLRIHKLNKFYEHIPYIISKLTGVEQPMFSPNLEEHLRNMFKEIQTPFKIHKPKDRKNFLSYSYIFHKFLELLGEYKYLHRYPLLKSQEKLRVMDNIWQKICADLNWKFIPSCK